MSAEQRYLRLSDGRLLVEVDHLGRITLPDRANETFRATAHEDGTILLEPLTAEQAVIERLVDQHAETLERMGRSGWTGRTGLEPTPRWELYCDGDYVYATTDEDDQQSWIDADPRGHTARYVEI